jgi:hypothetical protein
MPIRKAKSAIQKYLERKLLREGFKRPDRMVGAAYRHLVPKSPGARRLVAAAAAGPLTYAALGVGGGIAASKAIKSKTASERVLASFHNELEKIASLAKHVTLAKERPMQGLASLAKDPVAQREALKRVQMLRSQGRLPSSLRSAPVPDSAPASLREKARLTRWLASKRNTPGIRQELRQALDDAMALTL